MTTEAFYTHIRGPLFDRFTQSQVDGINAIFEAFETHGGGDKRVLAYGLATAYHETGKRMVPVREGFKNTDADARAYVQRNYGHKGAKWYCWPAGVYGQVYYGRGIVQLTWLENYATSSADAGVDLVQFPDKMLDTEISARVMFCGLLDGRWNGERKGIAAYLDQGDIRNARRTVNGLDRWEDIAGYYETFLEALAGYNTKLTWLEMIRAKIKALKASR